MRDEPEFRHIGGGQKGVFLAVRYVFIVSASYLLVFHGPQPAVGPMAGLTIASALASNVALSFLPPAALFAWWVEAPVLVTDTLWVSWALHSTRALDGEFFLLYFFVLVVAAVGEDLVMVVLGTSVIILASVYASWGGPLWTSPPLLRIVFLFTAALFYGHVLSRLKSERQRGDLTLRWARELEAKVAERTSELNRLYEASRAANTAKSDFMASMSHELRTPLHVIIGYADMLVDPTAAGCGELAGHIRRAGTELLHLVDGVLEMGRLEAGKVHIEPRLVSLTGFVEEMKRREWPSLAPGVGLRWEVESTPALIETDPGKLQIVLGNLITNAIKYTRDGSIVVTVRDRPDACRAQFCIEDTGPGMPLEQLEDMREPFHESRSGSHALKGIGLGLAIVYRYAMCLGIAVHVRSTVGQGTSFRVDVPHRYSPRDAAPGGVDGL